MRVLLIDAAEELVHALVERLNLRVLVAEGVLTGQEAVAPVTDKEFDFVVLDLNRPGLRGQDLLANIEEHRPNINVVVITGLTTTHEGEEAVAHGAYECPVKPFDIEMLVKVMKESVESSQTGGIRMKDRTNMTVYETGLAFFGTTTASISHELKNALSIINELGGLMNDLLVAAYRDCLWKRPVQIFRVFQSRDSCQFASDGHAGIICEIRVARDGDSGFLTAGFLTE